MNPLSQHKQIFLRHSFSEQFSKFEDDHQSNKKTYRNVHLFKKMKKIKGYNCQYIVFKRRILK